MGSLFQDRACTCPELHVGLDSPTPQQPFRLLVLGGGYGGLSVALNLQDLCRGQAPRCGPAPEEGAPVVERPRFEVEIVIVDERDGFCTSLSPPSTQVYHMGCPCSLEGGEYARA
jgi:NADH dehydrogenase, FAD-containing subunit